MLSTLAGVPLPRIKKLLAELEERGIFSRTGAGVIYSRRMVRDEDLRERRAGYGKLGGNPNLIPRSQSPNQPPNDRDKDGRKDNPEVGAEVNGKVNPNPTPATATAFAFAVEPVVVDDARIRFSVAANRGLADHPTAPQPIAPISPNAGRTREITESILGAGVPVEFAESQIYELARSHAAERKVSSLKYFHDAVIRAWTQHQSPANGAAKRHGRNSRNGMNGTAPETAGDRSYADADAAFAAAGIAHSITDEDAS